MLQFEVESELCAVCGLCADDCPAKIINMETGQPAIAPEREENCLRCQHCMAVCPSGAISILGVRPEELQPLPERFPDLPALETLIRGRRSVRHYKDENVDPALLAHLLEVAWQAPTGKNDRQVQFTVVDDRKEMAALRAKVMRGIGSLAEKNALPEKLAFYANFARKWEEHGTDIVFRGAPHLLIATAPVRCATPMADCLIALTTFDLFAQAHGLGLGGLCQLGHRCAGSRGEAGDGDSRRSCVRVLHDFWESRSAVCADGAAQECAHSPRGVTACGGAGVD
jgi:ferredoxin